MPITAQEMPLRNGLLLTGAADNDTDIHRTNRIRGSATKSVQQRPVVVIVADQPRQRAVRLDPRPSPLPLPQIQHLPRRLPAERRQGGRFSPPQFDHHAFAQHSTRTRNRRQSLSDGPASAGFSDCNRHAVLFRQRHQRRS